MPCSTDTMVRWPYSTVFRIAYWTSTHRALVSAWLQLIHWYEYLLTKWLSGLGTECSFGVRTFQTPGLGVV